MKNNIKSILIIAFAIIGFALLLWGAIAIDQYPGMREMRKEAFQTVKPQYITGLVLMIIAYLLTYVKKRF